MKSPQNVPCVAGLEIQEAMRRLQAAGATVLITECHSRKGVDGADCVRVLREHVKVDPQTGMLLVELVVSAFKTIVAAKIEAEPIFGGLPI